MSGPKLSAYELEKRKRAEIAKYQSNIVSMKSAALSSIQTTRTQITRLERHKRIIEASSISDSEKELAITAIETQILSLNDLILSYGRVIHFPCGTSIEELKTDCDTIGTELKKIDSKLSATSYQKPEFANVLQAAVDDLCNTMEISSYSIEDALSELSPTPVEKKNTDRITDISQKRELLLKRANTLLESEYIDEQEEKRIHKAIRRIKETNNIRELDEIASLVLGEIERSRKQLSSLLSDYQQLTNTMEILALSLELPRKESSVPKSISELKTAIAFLKCQIEQMEQALLARTERKEIALCIDETMQELGYELIGSKTKGTRNSIFTLYNFHGTSGLQVVQREDGVVRIQVVGLSNETHTASNNEEDYLLHEQELFCEDYEEIVRTIESKGIREKKGSIYKNPPDRQFNAYVNVHEYDPLYRIHEESGSTADTKGKKKQQHKTPKIISKA